MENGFWCCGIMGLDLMGLVWLEKSGIGCWVFEEEKEGLGLGVEELWA